MKKITKLLSVFVIAGAIGTGIMGATGCKHKHTYSDEWTSAGAEGHYHMATCKHTEEHTELVDHVYDDDKDTTCNDCGYVRELPKPTPDPKPEHTTHDYDWKDNGDGTHTGKCKADGCNETVANEAHTWGTDKKCTKCGHVMTPTDLNADDLSATPIIVDTYADETGTPAQVAAPKVPTYEGPAAALTEGQVDALFEFDPATLSTTKYAEGWTNGSFTLANGTEVRGRVKTGLYEGTTCVDATYMTVNSVKLGSSDAALKINVPAAGTLVFHVQNGSSGTTGTQTLVLTKPDGSKEDISYPANGSGSTIQRITKELTDEGEYTIQRKSGTSDIYYAKFTTTLDESPVTGIEVANTGKTEFLVGQQLDCTAVSVVRVHETNVTIPVSSSNIEIDASEYNPAVAGTYSIKVKYTLEGNLTSETKVFNTSYDVNVYDYGELSVSVEHVKQGANSAAGNGTYVNNAFRQFYTVGETFSTEGITLSVVGKLGEKTKNFKLDASSATITGADLSKAGVQTVKIAYTINGITKAKGVLITVKAKPDTIQAETEVMVAVNKDFAQENVGTKNAYGAYRFNTIQQALEFIEAAKLDENVPKTMYLEEGTYWEKVEVNIPNLTIIGKGADKTKIEYNALYGVEDAGGFVHVTDSTATFNVRDKAVGFTIKNVAISNYYNSAESYTGAPSNDCRALAMLIQADKVVVEDCTLLGYQDTLELFTGRQIFKNCLIMGVTDYVFGTNNTTYFYKCELRNINHIKANQPGYVTAFKGNNKGSSTDKVTYGAIFDDCDFTAEEGVPAGQCAMGRAWGVDAAVMVMNSRIGGHISKDASTSQGGRYISMGNGDPAGAQFKEYNNTGDGAITESLATVDVLAEADAKNYNDFDVIFAKVNNLVTYSSAWDGSAGAQFTEKAYELISLVKQQTTYVDTPIDICDGKVFLTAGSLNPNANSGCCIAAPGTEITLDIAGKVSIDWYGGGTDDYGNDGDARIVYKNHKATIIVGNRLGQNYIKQIRVDMTQSPEDTVERTVTVYDGENLLATWKVNDGSKIALRDIKALISGNTYEGKELDKIYIEDGSTEFDVDTEITADTVLKITVKNKQVITQQTITSATTYTYDKSAESIEDTEYFKFTNCAKNGDWFRFGSGSSIEFTVAAGAVVTWTRSPYDNGKISINDVEQSTEKNGVVMYVCAAGGKITITASGDSFFKELSVVFSQTHTVSFNLNYTDAPAMDSVTVLNEGKVTKPTDPVREGWTFKYWYTGNDDTVEYNFDTAVTGALELKAKWEEGAEPDIDLTAGGSVNLYEFTTGQVQGGTAEFKGIIVDATTSGAKFAPRTNDVQVNAGVKIKFKVNAGTTADKISVSFTAAAGSQYIPTCDVAVEGEGANTYAVLTLGAGYPSTMTVAIAE